MKTLKHIEDRHKISDQDRIKFVSKSGIKLKDLIQRKDPINSQCDGLDCKPCENKVNGEASNCRAMNVTYKAQCNICKQAGKTRVYYGETCRNLHIRSNEHYREYKNKSKHSWMLQHVELEHKDLGNKQCDFVWSVIRKFKKPMQRQLSEAISIDNTANDEIINLTNENFKTNIKGIEINKKQYIFQFCSRVFDNWNELSKHIKSNHKQYKCQQCDYRVFGSGDINRHNKHKYA